LTFAATFNHKEFIMRYSLRKSLVVAVSFVALVVVGSVAQAVTVVSSNFSLGYGWTGGITGPFTTSETSGANTPTVIGDFTFTPSSLVGGSSGSGPRFPNRVLIDGVAGLTSASADAFNAAFSVAATYNGTLPNNITTPQIRINISQISLFTAHRTGFGPNPGLGWVETTAGHGQVSPLATGIASISGSGMALSTAANYTQLNWNPADFFAIDDSLAPGINQTRSFTTSASQAIQYAIDGWEIIGTVEVTYLQVPEPTTFALLGLGTLGLVTSRRRRTNRA
jgi:hypothetical protein